MISAANSISDGKVALLSLDPESHSGGNFKKSAKIPREQKPAVSSLNSQS